MAKDIDEEFYQRADSFIHLANEHCGSVERNKVSASFMYSVARFNAWISASGYPSGEDLRAAKAEMIEFFIEQYRGMLVENLDDYIENFEKYMKPSH